MDRNKIKVILEKDEKLYNLIRYIYVFIFYHDRLEQKKHYGKYNADKHILLIRPNTEDGIQGLMSLFIQTMRWVEFANRTGMVPFIDFKNYRTQYWDGTNIWEYYFTQPSQLRMEEVYNSRNVTISGTTLRPQVNNKLFRKEIFYDKNLCKKCHKLIWDNIELSNEVEEIVKKENSIIFAENCIGAYLRGTDYVCLQPAGENRQPTVDEFIKKLDGFVKKYPGKNIFLVTEDEVYYRKIKDRYKQKLKTVSFDCFIKYHDEKGYLSKTNLLNKNKKKRGMDYLVKLVLLSKCEFLVSSITMGSIAVYAMNGGKYTDTYVFDLGFYD